MPPKRESPVERVALIGIWCGILWGLFKLLDPLGSPECGARSPLHTAIDAVAAAFVGAHDRYGAPRPSRGHGGRR